MRVVGSGYSLLSRNALSVGLCACTVRWRRYSRAQHPRELKCDERERVTNLNFIGSFIILAALCLITTNILEYIHHVDTGWQGTLALDKSGDAPSDSQ